MFDYIWVYSVVFPPIKKFSKQIQLLRQINFKNQRILNRMVMVKV